MTVIIEEVVFGSKKYQQLLALRDAILRKPLGTQLSEKDTATDDKEFHIGAFDGEAAVGCIVLRPLEGGIIKLRQAAVADDYQGQGIGAKLVRFAEALASARGFTAAQMHARITAQIFYEKLGYSVEGEAFIEATVLNIKMHKAIA